jgi:hypothetical protein
LFFSPLRVQTTHFPQSCLVFQLIDVFCIFVTIANCLAGPPKKRRRKIPSLMSKEAVKNNVCCWRNVRCFFTAKFPLTSGAWNSSVSGVLEASGAVMCLKRKVIKFEKRKRRNLDKCFGRNRAEN